MKEVYIWAHRFRGFSPWLLCSAASEPMQLKQNNWKSRVAHPRATGGREKGARDKQDTPPKAVLNPGNPYHPKFLLPPLQ